MAPTQKDIDEALRRLKLELESPQMAKAIEEISKEILHGILQVELYTQGVFIAALVVEADGSDYWMKPLFINDVGKATEAIQKRWPGVPVVDMTDCEGWDGYQEPKNR